MENSKLMQNTINKIKKFLAKKININKAYFKPKFILAVTMVLAAGVGLYQVFAQVSTVNITSPTVSAKDYVKAGDQVPVYFDVTTNASGTGRLRVEIYSGSTTVGDTGYYDYTFLEGANNSLLANVLINVSAAEGTYNVKVSAQQPGVSGTWVYDTETGAVVVDNTAPTLSTVAIASNNTDTTKAKVGDIITLTIVSDETINTPTVAIAGHNANVTGSDKNWSATYQMQSSDTEGAVAFTVDFSDLADNDGTQVTTTTNGSNVTFDRTAPTVTISDDQTGIANDADPTVLYTFEFNEDVKNFTAEDVSVNGGTKGTFTSTDANTYTLVVTADDNSITDISVTVLKAGFTDLAGNTMAADATDSSQAVDTVNPTVISVTPTALNEASAATPGTVNVTITFSEAMDTETDPTVTVQGITGSPITVTKTSYTETTWQGTFTFYDNNEEINNAYYAVSGAKDANGNQMVALDSRDEDINALDVDTKNPTVAISDNFPSTTTKDPVTFTFTFSEDVTGFIADDITVDGGTKGYFASTSASVYTLVVSPTPDTQSGTITVDVAAGLAQDLAGNNNTAATQATQAYDTLAPTVTTIAVNDDTLTEANIDEDAFVATIDFSEAMDDAVTPTITFVPVVTTTLTNCAGVWSDADTYTYTCDVEDHNVEVAGVDIQVSGAKDLVGNTMVVDTTSGENKFSVDTKAPTVVSVTPTQLADANVGEVEVTITFSEAMDTETDPTVTVQGLHSPYTVTATETPSPWSEGNTKWTGTFTFVDDNEEVNNAYYVISGAKDTNGNTMAAIASRGTNNKLDVDTIAPTIITVALGTDEYVNAAETNSGINITVNTTGVEDGQTVTCYVKDADEPVHTVGPLTGNIASSTVTIATGALTTLSDGTITATCNVSDKAGNPAPQDSDAVTKDVVAPTAPSITLLDPINSTNKAAVTITGTGEANATIAWSINDTNETTDSVTGTGIVSGEGAISITGINVSTLDDDTLTASVALTDAAGNTGTAGIDTATKDTVAPTFTIAYYTDSDLTTLLDNNYMKAGTYYIKITSNEPLTGAPTISIAAEGTANDVTNGVTIPVSGNDYKYTRTILYDADAVGSVAEEIKITGTDTAGNVATNADVTSEKYTDTVAPTQTVVEGSIHISTDTGKSATDFVTNVAAQTITGTLSAELETSEKLYGSVDNGANWGDITGKISEVDHVSISWDGAILSGTSAIVFKVVDLAGNEGAPTGSQAYTLDTVAPTQTVVEGSIHISTDTGKSATDFVTNVAAQTITGTLSAELETGDTLWGSTNNGQAGTWVDITGKVTGTAISWDGATLAPGNNNILFKVTDAAGNDGPTSSQQYILDTTNPVVGTITITPSYTSEGGTTYISGTSDISAPITEEGPSGTLCEYNLNNSTWVPGGVVAEGKCTFIGVITTGVTSINVRATDVAGNTGTGSAIAVTVDIDAPTVELATANPDPAKAGTVTITVTFTEEGVGMDTSVSPTVTVTGLTTDPYTVTETYYGLVEDVWTWIGTFELLDQDEDTIATISVSGAKDLANNVMDVETEAGTFAVDTVTPETPTVSNPLTAITVNSANYIITGTAEAGSTVKVYKGGTLAGSGTADATSGEYSISVALAQDSVNNFTVTATDAAGNESEAATVPAITEDSIPPTVVIAAPLDGAKVNGDEVITFTDGELTNPQCSIDIDDEIWVTCISGTTKLADITGFGALPEGAFTLYLKDTDAAGNTGTTNVSLTKDTAAPTISGVDINDTDANGYLDEIIFTFSKDVSGSTANIADWTLIDNDRETDLLDGLSDDAITFNTNTMTIALADNSGTTGAPSYQYNGTSIKDAAGNPLAAIESPVSVSDDVAPVMMRAEAEEQMDSGDIVLTAIFSEPINGMSVQKDDFYISFMPSGGYYLNDNPVVDGSKIKLHLPPIGLNLLDGGTLYLVSGKSVNDLAGRTLNGEATVEISVKMPVQTERPIITNPSEEGITVSDSIYNVTGIAESRAIVRFYLWSQGGLVEIPTDEDGSFSFGYYFDWPGDYTFAVTAQVPGEIESDPVVITINFSPAQISIRDFSFDGHSLMGGGLKWYSPTRTPIMTYEIENGDATYIDLLIRNARETIATSELLPELLTEDEHTLTLEGRYILNEGLNTIQLCIGDNQCSQEVTVEVITSPVSAPKASVASGIYTSTQTVTLESPTPETMVYYTLNKEGIPDQATGTQYIEGAITISTDTTLRIIAYNKAGTASPVSTYTYIIKTPEELQGPAYHIITLKPGFSLISVPKVVEATNILESLTIDEIEYSAIDLNGGTISTLEAGTWTPIVSEADIKPLYGYLVENRSGEDQTLVIKYKDNPTADEKLFSRTFSTPGWYSIGVANPASALSQGENNILDVSTYSNAFHSDVITQILDYTGNANDSSVQVYNPSTTIVDSAQGEQINPRETRGYLIYVKQGNTGISGTQK